MMTERLLHRQTLKNGLTLEVYDRSRPMAGDRWQVLVEVRLAVPINPATMPPDLLDRAQEVAAALGPEIFFTHEEVRHFIDAREVPALLEEMQNRLLAGLQNYLSHPDFAGSFLRQKFAAYQERQRWYRE